MPVLKIYLDTNVYIDIAVLYEPKKEAKHERYKILAKLIKILDNQEEYGIEVIISDWSFMELKKKIPPLIKELSLVLLGYSPSEISDSELLEEIKIPIETKPTIKKIYELIAKATKLENNEPDIDKIGKMIEKGFGNMDAILIDQAESSNCNYFITRDKNTVIKPYNKSKKTLKLQTKIISPKKFVEKFSN